MNFFFARESRKNKKKSWNEKNCQCGRGMKVVKNYFPWGLWINSYKFRKYFFWSLKMAVLKWNFSRKRQWRFQNGNMSTRLDLNQSFLCWTMKKICWLIVYEKKNNKNRCSKKISRKNLLPFLCCSKLLFQKHQIGSCLGTIHKRREI